VIDSLFIAAGGAPVGIDSLFSAEALVALLTLTLLEIVLGIDNIVFIAILVAKLPPEKQASARRIGLTLAMLMRIILLLAISWIMGLTKDVFWVPAFWTGAGGDYQGVNGRDLILLIGGLFLIGKSTYEIHDKLEGSEGHGAPTKSVSSFGMAIAQILLLDLVFSLDSVITAVGMVQTHPDKRWIGLSIMIAAVVIAVAVMLLSAARVSAFVEKHPTVKMLALSFLLLIGVMLVAEGARQHIPKGYIYFAMFFSLVVEMMNLRLRKVSAPVKLHHTYAVGEGPIAAEK
jgi:predicted tellurium resistance membrane protein TerC